MPGNGATLEGRVVWATLSWDSWREEDMHVQSFINLGNAIMGKYTVSKERPPGDLV